MAASTVHKFLRLPWSNQQLLSISLVLMPYVSFAGLLGLLILAINVFRQHWRSLPQLWFFLAFCGISCGLVVNCLFSYNRAESFLQLVNFLPFFALFTALYFVLERVEQLTVIATNLVLAAIPINAIAIVEWSIKALRKSTLIKSMLGSDVRGSNIQILGWPDTFERTRVVSIFSHPNFLAGYLSLVFGLGLGLVLQHLTTREQSRSLRGGWRSRWLVRLIYLGTFINLAGIFCSGSRNAMIAAVVQLLIFIYFLKGQRLIKLFSLGGLSLVALGVSVFGIGGRPLSTEIFTGDPRVGIWGIALDLIAQRPWLGWGLGSFKFLYPPRLVDPAYPYISHPHNFWLLMASEAGIPLMLAFTVVIGYTCFLGIKAFWKTASQSSQVPHQGIFLGYLLALFSCIAFALFDVTLYDARINVLNWFILAAIYFWGSDRGN
jgi:O-antigen ligase